MPPLNKQFSMSLPSMVQVMLAMLLTMMMMILQEYVDPRDVKMNELEKVIAQYQDKLNDVTSNYQQKIGMFKFFILVDTLSIQNYRDIREQNH